MFIHIKAIWSIYREHELKGSTLNAQQTPRETQPQWLFFGVDLIVRTFRFLFYMNELAQGF